MTRSIPTATLPAAAPQSVAACATDPGAGLHRAAMQYLAQNQQKLAATPAYCQGTGHRSGLPSGALGQTSGQPLALSSSAPASLPHSARSALAGQQRNATWRGTRALAGLTTLTLAALFATPAQAQAVGPVSKLVVTQNGQGPADNSCASFRLSAKQAQAFFKRAVLITERQNHDHFDRGPCTVSGTFKTRFDTWEWEIRNGGTAAIMSSNGDSFLLADPRQASAPD